MNSLGKLITRETLINELLAKEKLALRYANEMFSWIADLESEELKNE